MSLLQIEPVGELSSATRVLPVSEHEYALCPLFEHLFYLFRSDVRSTFPEHWQTELHHIARIFWGETMCRAKPHRIRTETLAVETRQLFSISRPAISDNGLEEKTGDGFPSKRPFQVLTL